MRAAAAVAAEVLHYATTLVAPGVTTDELDAAVHEECVRRNVYPSPLGYAGFPKSLCTSVNEVVCHGIPDSTVIRAGDVVKLDVSCFLGGVHGDTCRTVIAGGEAAADPAAERLVAVTRRALYDAIAVAGPGVPVRNIGIAITASLNAAAAATGRKYAAVREFAGHGIGATFHTEPLVYHYVHYRDSATTLLLPGMTFTIEPMVVDGAAARLGMWPDGWTAVTKDGAWSAQFEHTLLVTPHGVEVLTAAPGFEGPARGNHVGWQADAVKWAGPSERQGGGAGTGPGPLR